VADGDTIVTSTVDARGVDGRGRSVGGHPNPQTGPFHVEGARPGDALAVHFDRIEPNRDTGYTQKIVAPNVVDPDYLRQLPENTTIPWRIDRAKRVAWPECEEARLGNRVFPLSPMLGCFGVAPDRGQAIWTATSGPHGGNMDYRGFAAGVTAYFPVFVEGALLHLGDGHAVQGHGEIVGTGVEVSMDVEFTVRVQKGRRLMWPRGESRDAIFTVGNARPLDQALQHATTEMLRWLQEEWEMTAAGASIVLGQAVEYEIGNVFDPAYTVVCSLPKCFLPGRS
jgi:acetamidase/formamidase